MIEHVDYSLFYLGSAVLVYILYIACPKIFYCTETEDEKDILPPPPYEEKTQHVIITATTQPTSSSS
jgi:hypothetical protein